MHIAQVIIPINLLILQYPALAMPTKICEVSCIFSESVDCKKIVKRLSFSCFFFKNKENHEKKKKKNK